MLNCMPAKYSTVTMISFSAASALYNFQRKYTEAGLWTVLWESTCRTVNCIKLSNGPIRTSEKRKRIRVQTNPHSNA